MDRSGDAGAPTPAAAWSSRYAVEDCLGAAGPDIVFAARDSVLRREVIAVVRAGPSAEQDALLDRARALSRSVDCAVHLFDCAVSDGVAVVVTELPPRSLADMRRALTSTPGMVRAVCTTLGAALAALHRAGVGHVGLRPETVGFDEDGRLRLSLWPLWAFEGDPEPDDLEALGALVASLGDSPAAQARLREIALDAYHGTETGDSGDAGPRTAPVPRVPPAVTSPVNLSSVELAQRARQAPPSSGAGPAVSRLRSITWRTTTGAVAAAVALLAVAAGVALAVGHKQAAPGVSAGRHSGHAHAAATTTLPPLPPPATKAQSPTAPSGGVVIQANAVAPTTTPADAPTTTTTVAPTTTTTVAPTTTTTRPSSTTTTAATTSTTAAG